MGLCLLHTGAFERLGPLVQDCIYRARVSERLERLTAIGRLVMLVLITLGLCGLSQAGPASGVESRATALQPAGLTSPSGPSASGAAGAAARRGPAARPVDVNAATAAELEQVRGIGPALALRIVKAREATGRFRDTEDLRQRVRGIGVANLKRMQSGGLVIAGAARIEAPAAAQRHSVELLVGNRPGKSDRPGAGRVDEMPCCRRVDAPTPGP